MKRIYVILLYLSIPLLILSIIFSTIAMPLLSISAMQQSLLLCFNTIIPTLFPFFILSNLLLDTKFPLILGRLLNPIMKPLFCVSGVSALPFSLGLLAGYPNGAKITCELYASKQISKNEAELLLAYTNNCGPLFLTGSVACSLLGQPALGPKLLVSHWAASLLVGMLLGTIFKPHTLSKSSQSLSSAFETMSKNIKKNIVNIITNAFSKALESMLLVCSFILFFSVLAALANELLLNFHVDPVIRSFLLGLIEISNGASLISALNIPLCSKLPLISFVIGFGGLGVYMQVLAIAHTHKLKMSKYIIGKLLQGVVGAIFTMLL